MSTFSNESRTEFYVRRSKFLSNCSNSELLDELQLLVEDSISIFNFSFLEIKQELRKRLENGKT